MELTEILVKQIEVVHPPKFRQKQYEERIRRLIDLRCLWENLPVIVASTGSSYVVIDGNARVDALRRLSVLHVQALVVSHTDRDHLRDIYEVVNDTHQDLVGVSEIATIAGVSESAVQNWRRRYPDMPKPAINLKSGPVWDEAQIQQWLISRRETVPRRMLPPSFR